LGGYSHKGFAWHFYLPDNLEFCALNNHLEHLAAIITPWINIFAGQLKEGNCALSMTDSTTSEGWLHKSNFIKEGENPIQATIQLKVASLHTTRLVSTRPTTSQRESENTASGSLEPITMLSLPSPRTLIEQRMN
jgi:hypothetical protein